MNSAMGCGRLCVTLGEFVVITPAIAIAGVTVVSAFVLGRILDLWDRLIRVCAVAALAINVAVVILGLSEHQWVPVCSQHNRHRVPA